MKIGSHPDGGRTRLEIAEASVKRTMRLSREIAELKCQLMLQEGYTAEARRLAEEWRDRCLNGEMGGSGTADLPWEKKDD